MYTYTRDSFDCPHKATVDGTELMVRTIETKASISDLYNGAYGTAYIYLYDKEGDIVCDWYKGEPLVAKLDGLIKLIKVR